MFSTNMDVLLKLQSNKHMDLFNSTKRMLAMPLYEPNKAPKLEDEECVSFIHS
jgi:hypothetical protein